MQQTSPQPDNKTGSTAELPALVLGVYTINLFALLQLMHWITHFQYSSPKINQTTEIHKWLYLHSCIDIITVYLKIHKDDMHRQIGVVIFAQSSTMFLYD